MGLHFINYKRGILGNNNLKVLIRILMGIKSSTPTENVHILRNVHVGVRVRVRVLFIFHEFLLMSKHME